MSYRVKSKRKMNESHDSKWQAVSLDVYGDSEDWYVNNVFNTGKYIDIDIADSDDAVMRKLDAEGLMSIRRGDYGMFEDEDTFAVYDRNDMPFLELRSPDRHIM